MCIRDSTYTVGLDKLTYTVRLDKLTYTVRLDKLTFTVRLDKLTYTPTSMWRSAILKRVNVGLDALQGWKKKQQMLG